MSASGTGTAVCKAATIPESNTAFWRAKFDANVTRHRRNAAHLRRLRWSVITVWECQLRAQGLALGEDPRGEWLTLFNERFQFWVEIIQENRTRPIGSIQEFTGSLLNLFSGPLPLLAQLDVSRGSKVFAENFFLL